MVQRFGNSELLHLTDPTGSNTVDAALVALALADAGGEVDSYLAAVLTEPLTVVPPRIVSVACDLARYRLYALAGGEPEQVQERYDAAVRWLKDIATGKARLAIPPAAGEDVAAHGAGVAAGTRTLVFDGTAETGYLSMLDRPWL